MFAIFKKREYSYLSLVHSFNFRLAISLIIAEFLRAFLIRLCIYTVNMATDVTMTLPWTSIPEVDVTMAPQSPFPVKINRNSSACSYKLTRDDKSLISVTGVQEKA